MKKFKFLFSGTFAGILLVIFAFAIGYATIVENNYDANTAKFYIYNARWFEILMFLMVVNFSGMIFTRKLYQKSKLNIMVIHLSFVVILIGAGLTRYIGFEGQMRIRNGQTTNKFFSSETYFITKLRKGTDSMTVTKKILLSPTRSNHFEEEIQFGGEKINISFEKYYSSATEQLVELSTGSPYLHLVAAGLSGGRQDIYLAEGESKNIPGLGISFGDTTNNDYIQIIRTDGELIMKSPFQIKTEAMSAEETAIIYDAGSMIPTDIMKVYSVGTVKFLIKEFYKNAAIAYNQIEDKSQQGIRVANVKVNNDELNLIWGEPKELTINDVEMNLAMGYQLLELPFSLRLNKFLLERYPGSESPSSFTSDITLIDEKNNVEQNHMIFMNNILEYKGYRFYQSSYDPDEQGTILSINRDYWGTLITYIGYFLLFASLIFSFFTKETRFTRLAKKIREIHNQRKNMPTLVLFILLSLFSVSMQAQGENNVTEINKKHAKAFGKLHVQNHDGRVVAVNSIARKVLIKMYKTDSYEGLNADQVFLGMMAEPEAWQNQPLITVRDQALRSILGTGGKYAKFSDFFDEKGQYKLKEQADRVYIKKPALRSTYEKELLNVNERVNVCYLTLNSSILKIFPLADHPNNNWVTPPEFHKVTGHGTENGDLFENYLRSLKEAVISNNYAAADAALAEINKYQLEVGKEIIPSELKTKLEIFYNNINIFKRLFPLYLLLGIVLVGFFFIQMLKPSFEFKIITRVLFSVLFVAFILQTLGLILRWYIAGHAPWSNGYESMIYISWATLLAGFLFMKKSPVTLSLTALLSGITLLTAHMSWMNPEITNLVPVLKSYWLTIHVATITASYGFLALGAMIGLLNLFIMIFRNKSNMKRLNLTLKELALIIEMSLIVGVVLLVIGNFLGGIWANESWGRYWGWDSKETWSLVTIIVYSFVLHHTIIPGLKNRFVFNFLAVISFSSVLMTYFGVNYFLTGLHSYAQGDIVVVPMGVYYALIILAILGALAAYSEFKLKKAKD